MFGGQIEHDVRQMSQRQADLERIVSELKAQVVELANNLSQLTGGAGGGSSSNTYMYVWVVTAIVTRASGTGSPWTPGSGTGNQYLYNTSTLTWTAGLTGVTLWNLTNLQGAIGACCGAFQDANGSWWVSIPDKCANWT